MLLTIQESKMDPGVLEMKGRICLGRECQEVEWRVADLLKREQKRIIFDLAGVSTMDSTGVGILVTCFGRLRRAGGELRLAGPQGKGAEVLSMTTVDRVIGVFPTAAEAAQSF